MPVPTPPWGDMRVFEWLGAETNGVPHYLRTLNLVWSDEDVEHDLAIYRRVAERLAGEPAYWAEIIRESSWRHCLVGCACLLASARHEFFDDLCYSFRAGSFVAPQIAVTLGLLHASKARPFFESVLEESALRRAPKQAVSAHRVLSCLGADPAHHISVNIWSGFERSDAMVAEKVVAEQWHFWSSRV
jgi:hypothetical protein